MDKDKVIIVDPGYSNFKFAAYIGKWITWKEPSAVAEVPSWALQVDVPEEHAGGGVTWRGLKFVAGQEAMMTGLPIPLTSNGSLWEIALPVFLLKHTRLGKERAKVVVLVSPADWGLRDRIAAILAEAGFSDVQFMPQGLGVWLMAGAPPEACIIDIGFNTVDVLFAKGRRLLKDLSISVKGAGLIAFLSKLERDDPFMLSYKLEQGDERLAQTIRAHYWSWLQRQLQARPEWNARPRSKTYVGGGGAVFLKGTEGLHVVKNPDMANVLGVAKLLQSRRVNHESNEN